MSNSSSLLIAADDATFRREGARLFAEASAEAVRERGCFTAVLSGGSTPGKVYQEIAGSYWKARIPWPQVDFFWGDERCVSPDDAQSNYRMAAETLLDRAGVPQEKRHRMKGEMRPFTEAARDYQNQIKAFFKADHAVPQFDFVFMGLGEDGHTASLFPQTAALGETQRWVVANPVEKLGTTRLTLTYPIFNRARRHVFLVAGESKAAIVADIFRDGGTDKPHPAQRIRQETGKPLWLLDRAAASQLPASASARAVMV